MKEGLKEGIKQFMAGGRLSEKSNLLITATDNYFKAIVHASDFFIFDRIGKIPGSHTERFRILESMDKELYGIIDALFNLYVKSYRSNITKEEFLKVKDGLVKTLRITGLEKEFIGYLQ